MLGAIASAIAPILIFGGFAEDAAEVAAADLTDFGWGEAVFYIASTVGSNWGTDFRNRHKGYRKAMQALGLSWEPELQVVTGKHAAYWEGVARILAAWLALPSPPTAIICGNDHTAAQFAEAIRACRAVVQPFRRTIKKVSTG